MFWVYFPACRPYFAKHEVFNAKNDAGVLRNVRIEFAGKAADGFPNFNGLTLAGVGNLTKIDFVQVSYSINNSFYVLGGGMNLNNLVSYKCKLDDFEFVYPLIAFALTYA